MGKRGVAAVLRTRHSPAEKLTAEIWHFDRARRRCSTMVVGDAAARGFHGAVTVFQLSGDAWTAAELPASQSDQTFGAKVAIAGDGLRLAVSDPDRDAVSLFSKTSAGWSSGTQVPATNPRMHAVE